MTIANPRKLSISPICPFELEDKSLPVLFADLCARKLPDESVNPEVSKVDPIKHAEEIFHDTIVRSHVASAGERDEEIGRYGHTGSKRP
jgi:hypothetical protein